MPIRNPLIPILALAAVLSGPVRAQGTEPDPELARLYRLALSAEMCGFPMSKGQAAAVGKAMDKRVAALKLSDDAADAAFQAIEAAIEAEGWDGLCAKGGAWEKTYQAELRRFGR